MNDVQWLALILAGVYLVECVVRVPSGGLVLRRSRGVFRVVRPAEWADVLQGGLVVDDPLPPLDGNALLQPWTLSLSPDGVVARADGRDGPVRRFVAWDDVVDVTADGLEVVVDETVLARFVSPQAAHRIASTMAEVAEAPARARERAILAALDARLDEGAVAARRKASQSAVARVQISANILFVAVLGFILGIAGTRWLDSVWLWLLLAAVVAWIWTLLDFSFAHRRLHPGADALRRKALLGMGLSPLGAIRAASVARRDVYAAWDPLAVASVLCDDDGFRDYARRLLCDLRHPPPSPGSSTDEPGGRCEEWFRSRLVERAEQFLRRKNVDPAGLLAPPAKSFATSRGYCPRCRAQYEMASGACADCGGVAIVGLEPSASAD